MDSNEIIKRVQERVYFEVKRKYSREDLDKRIRDVLYYRSETYKKLVGFANGKRIKRLADPRNFEKFMDTKGAKIIEEVLEGLTNPPKMQAVLYEQKVLEKVRKWYQQKSHPEFLEIEPDVMEHLITNSNCYKKMKKRLHDEQDYRGFVYSDNFEFQLIYDTGDIEEEIYLTITLGDYLK